MLYDVQDVTILRVKEEYTVGGKKGVWEALAKELGRSSKSIGQRWREVLNKR